MYCVRVRIIIMTFVIYTYIEKNIKKYYTATYGRGSRAIIIRYNLRVFRRFRTRNSVELYAVSSQVMTGYYIYLYITELS